MFRPPSEPWVATKKNPLRVVGMDLPRNSAFDKTIILPVAPPLWAVIQTAKGGRPSN